MYISPVCMCACVRVCVYACMRVCLFVCVAPRTVTTEDHALNVRRDQAPSVSQSEHTGRDDPRVSAHNAGVLSHSWLECPCYGLRIQDSCCSVWLRAIKIPQKNIPSMHLQVKRLN